MILIYDVWWSIKTIGVQRYPNTREPISEHEELSTGWGPMLRHFTDELDKLLSRLKHSHQRGSPCLNWKETLVSRTQRHGCPCLKGSESWMLREIRGKIHRHMIHQLSGNSQIALCARSTHKENIWFSCQEDKAGSNALRSLQCSCKSFNF